MRTAAATALLLLLFAGAALRAAEAPQLRRHVTDLAGVLAPEDVDQLDSFLTAYEQESGNQFVVLVVPSLDGASIEEFSLAVAVKNGIGREGKDNGLLLLVAVQDRKLRFEVGYGLEGTLTDALTSTIIRRVIAPAFREGRYGEGIRRGMEATVDAVSGRFTPPPEEPPRKERGRGFNLGGLILLLIFLFFFLRRGRRGGGFWFIGPFIGGGGFGGGGGFSGGGFGGGGFSGGGGSFGGGGSSGSW